MCRVRCWFSHKASFYFQILILMVKQVNKHLIFEKSSRINIASLNLMFFFNSLGSIWIKVEDISKNLVQLKVQKSEIVSNTRDHQTRDNINKK